MYWDHMSGWDWVWGTFMMGFWVVLLGLAVYIAVRLVHRDREPNRNP